MSPEVIDLDRIKALANSATPGPWVLGGLDQDGNRYIGNVIDDGVLDGVVATSGDCDAEFIANARSLVPALIARIRDLEAENTRIQARQVADVADRIDSRSNAMVIQLTEALVRVRDLTKDADGNELDCEFNGNTVGDIRYALDGGAA
jgi:hypothetical protein